MTSEEYIASGVLEIYATGGLTARERADVEQMVHLYPEIQAELEQIEFTLEAYARLHATTPSANLKDRILKNIAPENPAEIISGAEAKEIKFQPGIQPEKNHTNYSWLAAAAVILLLISAGLNWYFYSNWRHTENSLQIALNQQTQLAQNMQQAKFDLTKTETALSILDNPETRHVTLKALSKAPGSVAMIHWDPRSKMVLLEVKKLPSAPAGKQYQLWALDKGKPINAGMFSPTDTLMGMQQMKTINEAQAFAITLEPTGGSAQPTMAEMYLMGNM